MYRDRRRRPCPACAAPAAAACQACGRATCDRHARGGLCRACDEALYLHAHSGRGAAGSSTVALAVVLAIGGALLVPTLAPYAVAAAVVGFPLAWRRKVRRRRAAFVAAMRGHRLAGGPDDASQR